MRDIQKRFAAQLGLQRRKQQAQHQEVKRFYGLVKEINPQLEPCRAYSKPGSSITEEVE